MKKNYTLLSLLLLIYSTASCQTKTNITMEGIIDAFVLKSHNNLSFQNGQNVFISEPESDKDALEKGFQLMHVDTEQNGGWEILAAKDVTIEKEDYRAVLYEYQAKKYIVLYKKEASDKYYFRIYNAFYSR